MVYICQYVDLSYCHKETYWRSSDHGDMKPPYTFVTIGLCISLYLWAVMLRVGRYVAVGHSSGCGCLGDHESYKRATRLAYVSGDTRGAVSLSRGSEERSTKCWISDVYCRSEPPLIL